LHKGRNFVIGQRFRSVSRRQAALALATAGAALLGTALLGTALLAATPARADSDCAGWGPQKGIAIGATAPSGVYCFGVDGSGHQVSDTYGKYYFTSITLHAALYHEREVVRFYDKKKANYALSWSRPTRAGDTATRTGRRTFTAPCDPDASAVPCAATDASSPPSAKPSRKPDPGPSANDIDVAVMSFPGPASCDRRCSRDRRSSWDPGFGTPGIARIPGILDDYSKRVDDFS
jgi:hypothetical protein